MKILLIQTAFIGDVILATSMVENIAQEHPNASIDVLVRKGNESLLNHNPHINNVLVLNKKKKKFLNTFKIIKHIRKERYDYLINAQRFFTTGLISALSAAKHKRGYSQNPLSFFYHISVSHSVFEGTHEIERNHKLLKGICKQAVLKPKLYPSKKDLEWSFSKASKPYYCIAPASVWFTKQYPKKGWINLINRLDKKAIVYVLGGMSDKVLCEEILKSVTHPNVEVLAGKLSFLESASLMKKAKMNYVNDSAPLHIASAMNAPVKAIFCSTIPSFGFGPLSEQSEVIQTKEHLECRPCGIHGKKACPKGHFKCGEVIL